MCTPIASISPVTGEGPIMSLSWPVNKSKPELFIETEQGDEMHLEAAGEPLRYNGEGSAVTITMV